MAEIIALEETAKRCLHSEIMDGTINIWTDCQKGIKSIDRGIITSKTIFSCISTFNKLASLNKKVDIYWIPKALKNQNHQEADALAKSSLRHSNIQIPNLIAQGQRDKALSKWVE